MLRHMIAKDIHRLLTTHTFFFSLVLLSVVLSLGFVTNAQQMADDLAAAAQVAEFSREMLVNQSDYMTAAAIGLEVRRQPYVLHIFEQGITNNLGEAARISEKTSVMLDRSPNSQNPIMALFRELDFSFAVVTLLSLMAILASYDAICGERRSGTLKLMLINGAPRYGIVLSKILSAVISLSLALIGALAVAVSILWILMPVEHLQSRLMGETLIRIGLMLLVSLLYLLIWVSIGVLISSLVEKPAASFIVSFMVWVLLVAIVPQVSAIIAERTRPAESYASMQTRSARQVIEERENRLAAVTGNERWVEATRSGRVGTYLANVAKAQLELQQEVMDRNLAEYRRRHDQQRSLATAVSRLLSPAAAVEFAVQQLSGSGWDRQARYLEQLRVFKLGFLQHLYDRLDAVRPEKPWQQWDLIYQNESLDIGRTEARFDFAEPELGAVVDGIIADIAALASLALLVIFAAVVAINRYDVR